MDQNSKFAFKFLRKILFLAYSDVKFMRNPTIFLLAFLFVVSPHSTVWSMDDTQVKSDREEMSARARQLINLAYQESEGGQYRLSEEHYAQALKLLGKVYPASGYPNGHPYIASLLYDLGNILHAQDKMAEATERFKASLEMWRKLHTAKDEPQGHPEIAMTLVNLGVSLAKQGKLDEALLCEKEALQMRRRLYPRDRFPLGHLQIVKSLGSTSYVLSLQGRQLEANTCRQAAVEMANRLQTGKPSSIGREGKRKITFDATDFYLTFSKIQAEVPAFFDEYVPIGENLDHYDRMLTVILFPDLKDMNVNLFAEGVGKDLGRIDPECRPQRQNRNGNLEVLVDYVFHAELPEPLMESNVIRVMKCEQGLLYYQYSIRMYEPSPDEIQKFKRKIERDKSKWIKMLGDSSFPQPSGKDD